MSQSSTKCRCLKLKHIAKSKWQEAGGQSSFPSGWANFLLWNPSFDFVLLPSQNCSLHFLPSTIKFIRISQRPLEVGIYSAWAQKISVSTLKSRLKPTSSTSFHFPPNLYISKRKLGDRAIVQWAGYLPCVQTNQVLSLVFHKYLEHCREWFLSTESEESPKHCQMAPK